MPAFLGQSPGPLGMAGYCTAFCTMILRLDPTCVVQAKLVEEVSTMLNSFAARKAAEVAAAVGGMRTTLAGGRSDVDAKFCALTQATTSATSALQVGPALLDFHIRKAFLTPFVRDILLHAGLSMQTNT